MDQLYWWSRTQFHFAYLFANWLILTLSSSLSPLMNLLVLILCAWKCILLLGYSYTTTEQRKHSISSFTVIGLLCSLCYESVSVTNFTLSIHANGMKNNTKYSFLSWFITLMLMMIFYLDYLQFRCIHCDLSWTHVKYYNSFTFDTTNWFIDHILSTFSLSSCFNCVRMQLLWLINHLTLDQQFPWTNYFHHRQVIQVRRFIYSHQCRRMICFLSQSVR